MKTLASIVAVLSALSGLTGTAGADPVPDIGPALTGPKVRFDIDSGLVANTSRRPKVVFSSLITEPNAHWLRLDFGQVILAGDLEAGTGSFLRITSQADGAYQFLDAQTIQDWQHTSAYLNGDIVLVELIAYPGTGMNRVQVLGATAGEPAVWNPATICGPTDDRKPSKDPRSGRTAPVWCSAWMLDRGGINKGLSSAGHCYMPNPFNVVMFNVPLSTPGGGLVNPPPKDQYAVDAASVASQTGNPVFGNDFLVFGLKPNSTTGLTAFQAQGAFYTLADTMPATGVNIRITGYGTVNTPISPTWKGAQKTNAGGTLNATGNAPQYNTDTTQGDSGSPIINESTGEVIGVHGYGACDVSGGNNAGTGLSLTPYKNAVNNPKGVAAVSLAGNCYPDMDNSDSLDISDFITFQTLFAIGDVSANCDGSVTLTDPVNWVWTPTLTIDDFICFQTVFAFGC
jgi:Trypsin